MKIVGRRTADFDGDHEVRWKGVDVPYGAVSVSPLAADFFSRVFDIEHPPAASDERDAMTTVPLARQVQMFEDGFPFAVAGLVRDLQSPKYVAYIHALARARLVDGYALYGDEAYHWSEACRAANMDEEVADAIVYGTTGDT